MKLADLAEKLSCRLEGPPETEIQGVAGIDQATPGQITFLSNKRYIPLLKTTQASAVLIEESAPLARDPNLPPLAALRTPNPYLAFAKALELFYEPPQYQPGVHPTAVIARTARVPEGAHVGPYCFIDENVEIGQNAVLHSFVTIYQGAQIGDNFFAHAHAVVREHCRIGHRVILQPGAIIGGDGLGFAKKEDGTWHKMVQSGPAVLEDDVEVQSNSCIDRATVGETRIGRGTKIDDLVLVGHAYQLGANNMICGQTGLAGSTKIGDNCIFAGQSASSGHLTVGDNVIVTAQSGLPRDVEPNQIRSGSPAVDNKLWLKYTAALTRLPDLQKRVRDLESKLDALKPPE